MQRKRLDQLDSLRGLAALAIVVLHFSSYLFPATGNLVGHYSPALRRTYLLVDMFFILKMIDLWKMYSNKLFDGHTLNTCYSFN